MAAAFLVTGGTIGDSVAEGLLKKGRKVRITRRNGLNPVWQKAGVEQVLFDYTRPETLEAAFRGVDTYFSVSPLIQNLAETGIQAVEAAKRAGVKRIVRSSVLGAAEDGITFARWHRVVEKAVEESGLRYTIFQPSSFSQNYFFLHATTIKHEGKFYDSLGSARIAMVDARDIAECAVAVLTGIGHDSHIYKITGGEAVSSEDAAQILSEVIGKPVQHVTVSGDIVKQSMRTMNFPEWMIDGMSELFQIEAKGWLAGIEPDAERLLGRKPRTFSQFAQDFRSIFI